MWRCRGRRADCHRLVSEETVCYRPCDISSWDFFVSSALSSSDPVQLADDVVYNQSVNAASTLDKRRPEFRDELGYIAPPNRKLPPVPGSNYNTCDRIKRGTLPGLCSCSMMIKLLPTCFFCLLPHDTSELVLLLYFKSLYIVRTSLSNSLHLGPEAPSVRRAQQQAGLARDHPYSPR